MKNHILSVMLHLGCLALRAAEPAPTTTPQIIPLWPDGDRNNPANGPRPMMEIFRPFAPETALPATIMICPGGGYAMLSPYERLFAEFFRSLGYTAVVVSYRLAPNRHPAAYADATRAIRLLRTHGDEWKLPIKRIALMGGSAGGHLAALVATRPDYYRDESDDLAATVSARPDRLILAYPVISAVASYRHNSLNGILGSNPSNELRNDASPERHVSKDTPPVFLFHASGDKNLSVDNSIDFSRACWAVGVPAELHIFPHNGHGRTFAYSSEISPRWRELLSGWLTAWLKE